MNVTTDTGKAHVPTQPTSCSCYPFEFTVKYVRYGVSKVVKVVESFNFDIRHESRREHVQDVVDGIGLSSDCEVREVRVTVVNVD